MIGPITALERLRFATRKLRLPVPADALVLEVGSGDSPCPRSDVLFDLTLENHERVGGATIVDRTTVLGLAEHLPFKDGAFDFVIAFHVLEHSTDPAAFLNEMGRVARAGYIETPAAWVERVNPLTMHRSEVSVEPTPGGPRLVIRHKACPIPDQDMLEHFNRAAATGDWFGRIPREAVVTQYGWHGDLKFRIINPDTRVDWRSPPEATREGFVDPRSPLRRLLKQLAQRTHRPRAVDLTALLRCTACAHAPLEASPTELRCPTCGQRYPVRDGIPYMHPAGWTLR